MNAWLFKRFISVSALSAVWVQPVVWMVMFNKKNLKYDKLILPHCIIVGLGTIIYMLSTGIREYLTHKIVSYPLLMIYSLMGTALMLYLIKEKRWHYPQASAIGFLTIFIGSFYWEIPYNVRNAFITGFQLDWLLHLMWIFPVWYIYNTVGWIKDYNNLALWLSIGWLLSICVMVFDSIPYGCTEAARWDTALYMFNRIACSLIIFSLINKNEIPFKEEIENGST